MLKMFKRNSRAPTIIINREPHIKAGLDPKFQKTSTSGENISQQLRIREQTAPSFNPQPLTMKADPKRFKKYLASRC